MRRLLVHDQRLLIVASLRKIRPENIGKYRGRLDVKSITSHILWMDCWQ
jgi:hypothetical protein